MNLVKSNLINGSQKKKHKEDPSSRLSQINHMLRRLAEDTDVDVRGFVFPYLSPEERSKFISSTIQAMAESAENGLAPMQGWAKIACSKILFCSGWLELPALVGSFF